MLRNISVDSNYEIAKNVSRFIYIIINLYILVSFHICCSIICTVIRHVCKHSFPEIHEVACNKLTDIHGKACNNFSEAINKLALSARLDNSCEAG